MERPTCRLDLPAFPCSRSRPRHCHWGQLAVSRLCRQANGARLGWLLLPQERVAAIWRGGRQGRGERLENASRLDGSELVERRSDHGWRLNKAASQWLREADGAMTTGTREPPRLALPRHWMNQH